MTHFEIDAALKSMKLLVDTREQPTERLAKRIESAGLPYERRKLDAGDYSCECVLPGGEVFDLSRLVAIERKMNLDELCLCMGRERKRFEQEFERAKGNGTKIYLLVENASWEKVYAGRYRSLFTPKALIASIDAFRARYNAQLDFCKAETTGFLIRDILYRELKHHLEKIE